MKKRGMTAGTLVAIMITLVAFVLIAGTITRFVAKAEDKQAEVVCRNSLALRANAKVEVGPASTSTSHLCKTLEKKFSAETQEEAREYVAKAMEQCWWIWLEGAPSEIFGPRGFFGDDDKTKCFVCYNLIYENGPTISKSDLLNDLSKVKSKYKGGGSVLSYIQERGYVEIKDQPYNSGNIYSVVFASNIEESIWKNDITRVFGFQLPYNQNGIWLIDLNTLEKDNPCYLEKDIAGE